jgi:hypothetical protein
MAASIHQFGRVCQVEIGRTDRVTGKAIGSGLQVSDPIRIQFEVTETVGRTPNTADIKIYNLTQDHENRIKGEFDDVILNAGYAGAAVLLFRGNIRHSFAHRVDNDHLTEIDAADGDKDFRKGTVNFTLAAGSSPSQLVDHIVGGFASVKRGHVDIKDRKRVRGRVYSGMARDHLDDIAEENDANWSFQRGKLDIVPADSTLPGEAIVINAATGMVGSPELSDKGITVKCLLNPRIKCNGKIWLDNNDLKEKIFKEREKKPGAKPRKASAKKALARLDPDGIYKVIKVVHKGDNRGNDWQSEVLCIRLGNPIPAAKGQPKASR